MKRIGWENGTLVSKAKVSIGGNIYEVESEQYEGNTPLSAENLKKMEDNIEESIYEEVGKIKLKSLYGNSEGTREQVTLSETSNNYDYFYITFNAKTENEKSEKTIRIDKPNQKIFYENMQYSRGNDYVEIFSKFNINNNTITPILASCGYRSQSYLNGNITMRLDNINYMYITKVIGGKF